MKKKKIYNAIVITCILIIMLLIRYSIVSKAENYDENTIKISYEYDKNANKVIAKMISNVELKDTKPTWILSENKREYTKVFYENTKYTTPVQCMSGDIIEVEVEIQGIQPLKIEMKYEYNSDNNTVTAKMVSNTELIDTKPTWTLSENKREYTKVFFDNTKYSTSVQAITGKVEDMMVEVTQVKIADLKIQYEYNKDKNIVTAIVTSDIELNDTKPTWTLSENKKTYIKVFGDNQTYNTNFIDRYNNNIIKQIKITQIDKTPPRIKLDYKYNANDTVTIVMNSNEPLADTKPTWTLSNDKIKYSKTFSTNEDYYTQVQDIYGNTTQVYIKLKKKMYTYKGTDGSKIIVGYMFTSYNSVIVQATSNVEFQDTKPTWTLSEDRYTYVKTYLEDMDYSTPFINVNGTTINVPIIIDWFYKITIESGVYGKSGAAIQGKAGGSNLKYYRVGNGPNVFFATFCVHGFEDNWNKDGEVLVDIATNFYNRLCKDKDSGLAKKWSIYIIKEVNPDGVRLGYTKDGPGRTTLYSSVGKGIDINRSWQTGSLYTRYTSNRNYNGTAGFQAYEAASLRDFLLNHKATNGQTVLVDLHGWENQLIGTQEICEYYKQQYTSCRTHNYNNYGTQYLISWARHNLGAKTALVELPSAKNYTEVNNMKLSDKYINATLNMLKGL